ncbi:MAG: bifunctional folylpolyglutamate synthase/dihydrofolate synthase [Candidatus Azobacteroides sp.]|nr:bifunctional folylpolyglutamate synthase/dihydrofolate synthase [Candidatus Azobacteroides sp.]
MTYDETLEYLYQSAPMFQQVGSSAYKEGMENSFLIDKHLNYPHTRYKTIHVAGTNGKGSTSHLLASVLQEAGYKTGLYTSPHLLDFRERIKVNGEMIDKAFVVDFIERHRAFFESVQPSFFELTTGMAFAYFAEQQVDVAVIEVGLGGRLDCTNVITPVISIITNISFDHIQLLGNTLTAIAKEKAGIIKPDVPVVIGEAKGEVEDFFKGLSSLNNLIIFAQEQKNILSAKLLPSGCWEFETPDYPGLVCELGGWTQEKNAATVLCAINILKKSIFSLSSEAVYRGFRYVVENTGLMGRWQIVGQCPKIVLDTGHNVAGIEYIVRQLQSEKYDRLHIVFGMVNDKDITSVLRLLPQEAEYYFTQASIPRALDAHLLAKQAMEFDLKGKVYPTVNEAFSAAKRQAAEKDFIFVGGSTFVVADALKIMNYEL